MEVGVLGPVQVRRDGEPVNLGTRKQRALLAALALNLGRAVPFDTLVALLWGDDPPPGVSATLQSYVSGLRRALEPGRERGAAPTVLVTVGSGYALHLPAEQVDAIRFARVVTDVHRTVDGLAGDEALAVAVHRLDEVLTLWRGEPYAELEDAPAAVAERARLEELRLVALEDRAVANLARGQHSTVVGELEALTAAHPLRERLWALRALALTRSQRQAEALEVLREVRTLLAEELGLEPGAELRDLQAAILRQDAALEWRPAHAGGTAAAATAAATAGATAGRATGTGSAHGVAPPLPAPPATTRLAPVAGWPMMGRADELAGLVELLDRATAGTPSFAVVTGDPGIGKTRLGAELTEVALARGVRVLTGRCSQDDGAPPLWPWRAVLAGLGRDLPGAAGSDTEDEGAQFRSWEEIVGTVLDAAEREPLLVVLDDLHWSDRSTLRVLRLLAETARTGRLLLLTTWRPHPPPREALADFAESMARRHALRLELSGLCAADAAEVVEAVVHARPTDVEAAALTERTDGNPFFLVEYARLAAEGGDLAGLLAEPEPPTAVHDVLVRRLERLPDATRAVLRRASVVGRTFDTAALGDAAGDADLLDVLEPAVAAGLVREEGIDLWSFAHALVRDTVYAGLSATRRAHLHAAVAGSLDGRGRETEQARHWLEAGPSYAAKAWPAAMAAAATTRRLHAHDQSVELLTAARAALDADAAATDIDRWNLLMQLVDAYRWTGQLGELVEAEMEAVAIAERLGDDERLVTAASAMTLGLWQSAPAGQVNKVVVDALYGVLDRLPREDGHARCLALLSLANEEYFRAPGEQRRAWVEEALAMARRLGDADLLLDALLVAFIALFTPATGHERLRLATEATELALSVRNERRYVMAATLRAVVEGELGLVEDMRRSAGRARVEALRMRHQFVLVMLEVLQLPWLAMAGRFEECDERMQQMDRLLRLMGLGTGSDLTLTQLSLHLWRGDEGVPEAVAAVDDGSLPLSATVAACYLRRGEVDRAREHLAARPVDLEHDSWLSMLAWCHAAEVALGLGDAALADTAYTKLTPYAGRSSSAGANNAMGPVDAFLALAAAALGRHDEAGQHADQAARLMEHWEIPLAATWLAALRERHGF